MSTVANFVPRLVAFLVILLIGWLIAKALSKAADKILERLGFDRAVERGGVKKALSRSKYDASDIVSKIVYYTLMLFVLQFAFGVFGPNPIRELIQGVIAFLPKLFVAIVIVVVASAIAKGVKDIISSTFGGLSYGNALANIASVFIIGLGIIAALNQIDVAVAVTNTILIAFLATLGGIAVIGVGGGLIQPMQRRWEGWLATAEQETGNIRQQVQQSPSARTQAMNLKDHYPSETGRSSDGGATSVPRY